MNPSGVTARSMAFKPNPQCPLLVVRGGVRKPAPTAITIIVRAGTLPKDGRNT